MKYVDEFRDPKQVLAWSKAIFSITTRPWTIMEVCGGQTHSIVKYGLENLLPPQIRLIHGPGCPVCVTSTDLIDHALEIAERENTILCSYGDMLRVPGSSRDLLTVKAKGADVRILLSPLEAVAIAKQNPEREVVFFAVGFETTAPANAMAVEVASSSSVRNFSLLASHVLVPPALQFLLEAPGNEVEGFLAAGHVCTVMGEQEYQQLVDRYRVPMVITGFEPLDILQGLYAAILQLERGETLLQNRYRRSVSREGNPLAKNLLQRIYKQYDQDWRGIGVIPQSGLVLREEYAFFDAAKRFPRKALSVKKESSCLSGLVMQGKKRPCECSLFGKACTPETPVGAPMVSNEGACAAYYHYKRSAR